MRIALFGQREHGKTTVARLLRDLWFKQTNEHVDICSFSDPLKYAMSILSGMTYDELMRQKDTIPVGWKQTPREGMRKLSDIIKEVIHPDILTIRLLSTQLNFIIDDGRYKGEARKLQDQQCFNVLIYRPEKVNTDEHSSELWLLECYKNISSYANKLEVFDFILVNNDTLVNLEYKVITCLLPHYNQWVKDLIS